MSRTTAVEGPVSNSIMLLAELGQIPVIGAEAWAQLLTEHGGIDETLLWLVDVATRCGRPIGINAPKADPCLGSRTILLSPRNWSQERLQGWIGGLHEQFESLLGEIENSGTLADLRKPPGKPRKPKPRKKPRGRR